MCKNKQTRSPCDDVHGGHVMDLSDKPRENADCARPSVVFGVAEIWIVYFEERKLHVTITDSVFPSGCEDA